MKMVQKNQGLKLAEEEKAYDEMLSEYTKLESTYITIQQVLKWSMQILLLIFYHFIVFWLFPIASNEAIYGQPICK